METKFYYTLKDPASGGIFCLRTLLVVFLILYAASSFSQPKLEVAYAKKNFGFVKKGEVVKVMYVFVNKGDAPLLINSVDISCSCTTVDFPKQPLLPNQSNTITVSFDTKTVYNRQDREVYINSNDPRGPVKLRYKGIVLNK